MGEEKDLICLSYFLFKRVKMLWLAKGKKIKYIHVRRKKGDEVEKKTLRHGTEEKSDKREWDVKNVIFYNTFFLSMWK